MSKNSEENNLEKSLYPEDFVHFWYQIQKIHIFNFLQETNINNCET